MGFQHIKERTPSGTMIIGTYKTKTNKNKKAIMMWLTNMTEISQMKASHLFKLPVLVVQEVRMTSR